LFVDESVKTIRKLRVDLRTVMPCCLNRLGQVGNGQLQFVSAPAPARNVRVGAGLEKKRHGGLAARAAAGRHVEQVVNAVHLLLDHGCDRVLHRFRRRARVIGVDGDGRRRDAGILGDRQMGDGQNPAQYDEQGKAPRQKSGGL